MSGRTTTLSIALGKLEGGEPEGIAEAIAVLRSIQAHGAFYDPHATSFSSETTQATNSRCVRSVLAIARGADVEVV